MSYIAAQRLLAQRLTGTPFSTPVDAVRWLGAVQSQDYTGAKWALGQRARGATDADIDRLFDAGAIVRTHVMRPTWHFVLPEDVRWLLRLTGPRIRRGLAGRYRELELDDKVVARAAAVFANALAGSRHLTRPELGAVLSAAGISPDGQRLPHLISRGELDGLIVSGPRRGKQFTWALMEERVLESRTLDRPEAIAELTLRYFRSRGPAQVQDFVWWSGLTQAEARTGIAIAGKQLQQRAIEGEEYWFDAAAGNPTNATARAHLLPNFDEYTVGYRDRSAIIRSGRPFAPALVSFGSILSNVVIIGGLLHGAWRRSATRDGVQHVEVRAIGRLDKAQAAAVMATGRRFGRFLEKPVELSLV